MKKLTLPLSSIVDAHHALSTIEGKIPLALSWVIDDVKDVLTKHDKRFYAQRELLLEKYGTKSKGFVQTRYEVKYENLEKFNAEMDELGKFEVEIEFIPISYKALVATGVKVDMQVSRALRPLFEIENEKDA